MIRPYQPADLSSVLRVFKLNTPEFFDVNEQRDLEEYLQEHGETYFVMQEDAAIIGCGGYHFEKDGTTGRLSWDFFDPAYKGKGLGREMISHCLHEIKKNKQLKTISVWTSQLAHKFYSKFGFETIETKKDFWGPGLDLYLMEIPSL